MIEKISKIKKTAKAAKTPPVKPERYFEAVGRRKTAIARVRISPKKGGITVNNKDYSKYFPLLRLQKEVVAPFEKMKLAENFGAEVKVRGGGLSAQAEAIRHGISRALVKFNPELKKRLRRAGYLTRDPRMVERKKYGLKKARRAPQWKKR